VRTILGLLAVSAIAAALALRCAPVRPDGGEVVLTTFFRELEAHRFDAAASLVRDGAGEPLSAAVRSEYLRGWRLAYESYEIRFTKVDLRRMGPAPVELVTRAGGVEGDVYDVRFEGTSNSPCVPVSTDVLPSTTRPIVVHGANGTWFLLADALVGFVHSCPGA
jgi:hypothetical protein